MTPTSVTTFRADLFSDLFCAMGNRRTNRLQAGQAMIETLIGVSMLSLLGVCGVMVGKYGLIQQAVHGASHVLAFQCAIRPEGCQAADAPTAETQRVSAAHFTAASHGLDQSSAWSTRAGAPLIQQVNRDVAFSLSHPHFGAGLGVLSSGARSAAGSAVHVVSSLAGPDRFGLNITGGLVTAHAHATVLRDVSGRGAPDLLAGLPVTLRSQSAVLTDSWNASEPYGTAKTSVHFRVAEGQRLARWIEDAHRVAYAPTLGFLRLMGSISLEDSADKFRFHETDVDQIPADRSGGTR